MSLLPSKPDTSAVSGDAEPRVIGVDSDDAEDVISALSSETARKLLAELHDEPAPPSALADRVDTSLQNAQYHLQKLEAAGAVSVVDTAYSAKGREMDVYAPADQPLVIFAGDEDKTTGLKAALSRLIGGLGVLAVGSLVVQRLYGDTAEQSAAVAPGPSGGGEGGGAAGGPATATETATQVARDSAGSGDPAATPAPETVELHGTVAEATDTYIMNVTDGVVETTVQAPQTTTDTVNETATTTVEAANTAATTAGIEPGLLFFMGGMAILSLWMAVWYVRNR